MKIIVSLDEVRTLIRQKYNLPDCEVSIEPYAELAARLHTFFTRYPSRMTGDKIPCIKALREEFSGLSLLGAKLTVEELDVNKAAEILRNHWTPPVV